jgi:hypothetical protein
MISSFFAPKNPRKVKRVQEGVPMMAPSSSSMLKRERENDDDAQDASKKSKEAPKTSASKSSTPEVEALLSHLHCEPSDDGTWSQALDKHFSSPAFARLAQFVAQERYVSTRKRAPTITSFHFVLTFLLGLQQFQGYFSSSRRCLVGFEFNSTRPGESSDCRPRSLSWTQPSSWTVLFGTQGSAGTSLAAQRLQGISRRQKD